MLETLASWGIFLVWFLWYIHHTDRKWARREEQRREERRREREQR